MIPKFLVEKLEKQYGSEISKLILDGYEKVRKSTFRVNTSKSSREKIIDILLKEKINFEQVSWYGDAFIVDDIEKLRTLDIYNNGEIYVQSLSSMIPPIVLNPSCEKILDMAASPGGKTTEIYNLSGGEALITAVEKNPIRAQKLKYNIEKQGTSATVLVEDASKLDEFYRFDKILLDAPCSGSGTLSLYDNSFSHFSELLIKNSVDIQKKLLLKAIEILKKDHVMVYSTCSILYEENECQLENLIKQNKIEIVPIDDSLFGDIPKLPTKINGTLCICPNELYEGFYVALVRKI